MAQVIYESPPHGSSRLEDSKRPYEQTPEGGITVRTNRRIGEVRVPNYVYDLWIPVLGLEAIALYSVYCRMEYKEVCKGLSQRRLARLLRIGTSRLQALNRTLEKHGFISLSQPSGIDRLRHYTTVITVLDPPKTLSQAVIQNEGDGLKHGTLRDVLIDPDSPPAIPNGNADAIPNGNADAIPNGNASISNPYIGNPLICNPDSHVAPATPERRASLPKPPPPLKTPAPKSAAVQSVCDEFCKVYPSRGTGRSRRTGAACDKIAALIKKGLDPDVLLACVKRWRAMCDADGLNGGQFVPMATTWINDRVKENDWDTHALVPSPNGKGHPNGTAPTATVDPEELYAAEIAVAARLFADPPG